MWEDKATFQECEAGGPCLAVHPELGATCNREEGHPGQHAGRYSDGLCSWDRAGWTLAPGRVLCYEGKAVALLGRAGGNASAVELDDLAHILVAMLDRGNTLLGEGVTPRRSPLSFPIHRYLAEEARAVTPTTIPTD